MPKGFWVLWVAQVVAALGFGTILPTLPLFLLHHGVALPWLGALVAGYNVAAFVAQLVAGPLSDRRGRRAVLALGLLVSAAGMAGFLLPGSAGLYLGLRALWGVGAGAVVPVATAAVADLVPPEARGRAYGYLGTAVTGGTAIGPLLGAVVGRFSPLGPFLVAVPLNLAGAALVTLTLREPDGARPSAPPPPRPARRDRTARHLLGWWVPLLVSFAWGGLFGMYDTTWSLYLQRIGASPAVIDLSWTLFSLPLLGFSLMGGRLADRGPGRRRLVLAGIALNAVVLYGYSLVRSYVVAMAVSVVEAFASGLVGPSFQSLVMDDAPPDARGAVQGYVQGAATLGQMALALGSGYLLPLSTRDPFRLAAAVLALATVAAAWRWRPAPLERSRSV
jgi:DHA1 family tetracycline resistance protein-like MFS transporter